MSVRSAAAAAAAAAAVWQQVRGVVPSTPPGFKAANRSGSARCWTRGGGVKRVSQAPSGSHTSATNAPRVACVHGSLPCAVTETRQTNRLSNHCLQQYYECTRDRLGCTWKHKVAGWRRPRVPPSKIASTSRFDSWAAMLLCGVTRSQLLCWHNYCASHRALWGFSC